MKLPTNYVPGVGVKKATAYGGIGQRMMEKLGWKKGQGLGKDSSGMAEALEVKEKKDVLGVGAAGGWDWSLKFWEEAYNSAAQGVGHDGSSTSTSTSVNTGSGSDSDSSSSEDEGPRSGKKAAKPTAQKATKASPKKAASSSSSSSSSSDAAGSSSSSSNDSDSDSDGGARKRRKHGAGAATHRDGTFACGASEAELAIAAELAKDPWGRWGGKAGKMARIRQQEEEAAARARERLGLPPVSKPASAAASTPAGTKKQKSGKSKQKSEGAPAAEQNTAAPKKRIVITLTIPEDKALKRGTFVRTPATGWWGAGYFVSAGALEGMEEAGEHVNKQRTTFNEMDQANLYMQAHEHQRVGRKGLGTSTTVNIAGGKWEGTKKTFADEEEATVPQPAAEGAQQQPGEPAAAQPPTGSTQGAGEAADAAGAQPAKKQKGKKKNKPGKEGAQEAAQQPQQQPQQADDAPGGKKRKRAAAAGEPSKAAEEAPTTAGPSRASCKEQAASNGEPKPIKWLKVVKVMLKQAPKRRLRLEQLCKQLVQHAEEHHQQHAHAHAHKQHKQQRCSTGGMQRTYSQEDVSNILHKKAKKSKVLIVDGFVSLPA